MHVLVALVLLAVPETSRSVEPPSWEAWTGISAGLRPDTRGGGGIGLIGFNRSVGRVRPELVLGLGAYGGPADLLTLVRAGARFEKRLDRLTPYLWLAFAHNHETPLSNAAKNPLPVALGLSEDGVNHRSGLEAGVGVSYELPPRAPDRLHGRVGVRAAVAQMLGSGPPRYVDLVLSLGIAF